MCRCNKSWFLSGCKQAHDVCSFAVRKSESQLGQLPITIIPGIQYLIVFTKQRPPSEVDASKRKVTYGMQDYTWHGIYTCIFPPITFLTAHISGVIISYNPLDRVFTPFFSCPAWHLPFLALCNAVFFAPTWSSSQYAP